MRCDFLGMVSWAGQRSLHEAGFLSNAMRYEGRRWLECKTLRDGSVRITCDVTGDSAVYGMEM